MMDAQKVPVPETSVILCVNILYGRVNNCCSAGTEFASRGRHWMNYFSMQIQRNSMLSFYLPKNSLFPNMKNLQKHTFYLKMMVANMITRKYGIKY